MKKITLSLLICALLCLAFPVSGKAHPADMYYHTHKVVITPMGMEIRWEMIPGPMIAQSIWFEADQDQDNQVSPEEAQAWAYTILDTFSVEMAGETLTLSLDRVEWPSTVEALYRGEEAIVINLSVSWPGGLVEDTRVSLHNRFAPKRSLSWFEVQSTEGISFELPAQNSGTLDLLVGPDSQDDPAERLTRWESGSPSIPWVVESVGLGGLAERAAAVSQTSPAAGSGPASILEGLIKRQESSLAFILGALALAALLGALHALSPGHGKTIVAAYLVGSQGKPYHAVVLGAIITLTHTGSVFALGLLTLTASRYFLAANVFPFLELVSGLLILILGIALLIPRSVRLVSDYLKKRNVGKNGRPTSDAGEEDPGRLLIDQPIEESGPSHSHEPGELGALPRGPSPGNPLETIRWRSLVPLAISGGLVPCPDAIAILLVAAAINRIPFGLSLIVAFSFGLAIVLIAIGLLIVQGKRLFERLRWFNRAALVMPVLSAGIVLGIGLVLSLNAFRNVQATGIQNGVSTAGNRPDSFRLEEAEIIFLAADEDQQAQLFTIPAAGGSPVAVTNDANIWYFAISPDSSQVAFVGSDGANGSRIWTWNAASGAVSPLLECENAYCTELAWSPDGQGLLYSRLDFNPETNPANVQTIWWLDLTTLESAPLFRDAFTPGFSPRWSPDGKWLSYTSINPLEIKLYQMETGESQTLPSGLGYPAVWSPTSDTVILQDIDWSENGYLNKLFSYSLDRQRLSMLAFGEMFDDTLPAWSPDGEWLAVVRRAWVDGVPEADNQIWIMRPDGTDARQFTDTENYIYSQPAWSPDSRYLVFGYRYQGGEEVKAGIQILDTQTGRILTLVETGSRPAWLKRSQ